MPAVEYKILMSAAPAIAKALLTLQSGTQYNSCVIEIVMAVVYAQEGFTLKHVTLFITSTSTNTTSYPNRIYLYSSWIKISLA